MISSTLSRISLLLTLCAAFFPYFYMLAYRSDQILSQIDPVCIEAWPDKSQPPHRLCLSCFERDPDLVPTGLGLWAADSCDQSFKSTVFRAVNGISCTPLEQPERIKKIIQSSYNLLACDQLVQMFDYSSLNYGTPLSALNISLQAISAMEKIKENVNMTVSEAINQQSLYFPSHTDNLAVLQVTSAQKQHRNLMEIRFTSMDSIQFLTAGLSVLALSLAIFCTTLFFIKLFLNHELYLDIFANVVCLLGMLYVLNSYKLHASHRTYLIMDLEVVWACILLLKAKVTSMHVYGVATAGVLLSVGLIVAGMEGAWGLFFILSTAVVFMNGEEGVGYVGPCMLVVMGASVGMGFSQDIKLCYVKYVVMILSLGLVELTETVKMQDFQEYVESASNLIKPGKGFQRVEDCEMEEQEMEEEEGMTTGGR